MPNKVSNFDTIAELIRSQNPSLAIIAEQLEGFDIISNKKFRKITLLEVADE